MSESMECRPGGRIERAELSLYDAMVAELYAEQEIRMRKFERTHYVRSDKKHIKKNRRDNRSRLTRYFDRDLDNRFPMKGKFPEMTIRRYRAETRERIARADYEIEIMDAEMEADIQRRVVDIELEIKANSARLAYLYEAKEAGEILPGEYREECGDLLSQGDKLVAEFDSLNEWLKWA